MNRKAQLRNFSTVSFRTKFYTFYNFFFEYRGKSKKVGEQESSEHDMIDE